MRTSSLFALAIIHLVLFLVTPSRAQTVEWIRQFGTLASERTAQVSADTLGNVFVAGYTEGNFGGPPPATPSAYLRKYDAAGTPRWTRQLGPLDLYEPAIVAADGLGNAYLAGETPGNIVGVNAGLTDYFLRKYDSAGGVLWTRQGGSLGYEIPRDISIDRLGNSYLVGLTSYDLAGSWLGSYDAFLIKYDALGNQIWARQFGSSEQDNGEGVATDGLGNVYVAGYTSGDVGGPHAGGIYDMFLAKYDDGGNALWKRQLGTTSTDLAYDVTADALGNVYLVGYSEGTLGAGAVGGGDIVLSKFDSSGNADWTRQFGTPSQDVSFGASVDGFGNVYLGGTTGGNLGGPTAGPLDAFALKYLANGTLDWAYQIGSPADEFGQDVSHDGSGNVYFVGVTTGRVGATSAGGEDTFLVKLKDQTFAPEPSTLALFGMAFLLLPRRSRPYRRAS